MSRPASPGLIRIGFAGAVGTIARASDLRASSRSAWFLNEAFFLPPEVGLRMPPLPMAGYRANDATVAPPCDSPRGHGCATQAHRPDSHATGPVRSSIARR